jgi:PAS domain-containing protein
VSALFAEPGAGEAFMDRLRGELAQREYATGTVRLRALNGGILLMSYQATLMSIPRQGQSYYLVVAQEERDARERRANLQNVAQFSEEIPFPALRISPEGIVLYANRGSWLLLEHWQCGVGQLVPVQWREKVRAALQQRENLEVEVAIGFKTLLLVLVPVAQSGYLDIFGLDVTGRKQAEKKILFHSQVFENTTEGIVITDADRRIVDINRAFTTSSSRPR